MLIRLLTVLLAVLCGFATIRSAQRAEDLRTVETLAPGIELVSIKRGDFTAEPTGDRWMIKALIVDSRLARLRLAQAMDEIAGSETTSSMAARHGALAAINGGYFRTTGIVRGEPVGALAVNGKVLSEPVRNRAALAVYDDGKSLRAAISHLSLVAKLHVNGKTAENVDGFNRPLEKNELVVFTPEFHRTTLTSPDVAEAVVKAGRIVSVIDSAGSQTIPPEGYVISAAGEAREWALKHLQKGSRIEIKTTITAEPAISFKPDFILGGGPQLISTGRKVFDLEANRYSNSLYQLRHPRTAIGWRSGGKIVLVTVDGRQKQSVGMTIAELAGLMLEFGCVEAMNLDGGGSSAMVVRNRLVNNPSDTAGERAVSDAILIFSR